MDAFQLVSTLLPSLGGIGLIMIGIIKIYYTRKQQQISFLQAQHNLCNQQLDNQERRLLAGENTKSLRSEIIKWTDTNIKIENALGKLTGIDKTFEKWNKKIEKEKIKYERRNK